MFAAGWAHLLGGLTWDGLFFYNDIIVIVNVVACVVYLYTNLRLVGGSSFSGCVTDGIVVENT